MAHNLLLLLLWFLAGTFGLLGVVGIVGMFFEDGENRLNLIRGWMFCFSIAGVLLFVLSLLS